MSVLEQVQDDVRTAMKARDRERAAALRMIVDVLQQDAKLGKGDEVAVLQRERKKRVEAAEAYEGAGRAEQAAAERFEAELIEGYLPQQLSDEELAELVDAAVAETGASEQKQMGQVMSALMPKLGGRADGKRVSAAVRERWSLSLARRQLTLDNTVAAELAGSEDTVLRALRGRLDCDLHLRGNVLTLEGDPDDVQPAATVVDELVELIEQGHDVAPGTIEAVTGALDADESPAEILDDVVWRHRNTKVAPKTLNQKRYVDSIRRHTITFGIGPAGTGKTFLAVAMAAAALTERKVQRIILTRPAVEAGERLGFLPGDIQAKVDPYLRPLFDALYDMLDPDRVNGYFERDVIEVAPLAFMRGRTLNDSFVILDEAQNTSPEQMKMFLTRLGFNSRMVVTGDITQIDLPSDQRSGLIAVSDILDEVQDISFVEFGGEDVVRHKLVQRIVAAYDEHGDRERAARAEHGPTPRS